MTEKCHYCDRDAEYLCDFVLEHASFLTQPLPSDDDPDHIEKFMECLKTAEPWQQTCDRPLCSDHRVFKSWIFFCGKDGGMESHDMCPGHAGVPDGHKPKFDPIKTGGRGRAA